MNTPALIPIDVQVAFDDPAWGPRNNPEAEARIATLLDAWRTRKAPIHHVRHHSLATTGRFRDVGFAFKPQARPIDGEPVITKTVNSAFIGTDLETRLRTRGIDVVVIAGLTTDHCCSTTARMAANLGFEVWFVADATATFDRTGPDGHHYDADTMHNTALASLHHEFATVLDTRQAIERLRHQAD